LADYRIFETRTFRKDIAGLGSSVSRRIEDKLHQHVYAQLRSEPHFGPNIKRLKNWRPPTWRYRIRQWRFFYEIDDIEKVVFMTAAHHRRSAYG
jgi:mRNA interferase RelE/StbE